MVKEAAGTDGHDSHQQTDYSPSRGEMREHRGNMIYSTVPQGRVVASKKAFDLHL
ncbi:hypothetical protein GCM10009850_110280 [Nonomuraea monospora]|uniref:Uncharacterized protein n=1 Tax=Nonomuraea monospora TaxID=568818 RepID=A0ABP5PUZ0_9ACTN